MISAESPAPASVSIQLNCGCKERIGRFDVTETDLKVQSGADVKRFGPPVPAPNIKAHPETDAF